LAGGALLPRLLLTAGITALVVFKSLKNKNLPTKRIGLLGKMFLKFSFFKVGQLAQKKKLKLKKKQ
jgi:hypothetical protein